MILNHTIEALLDRRTIRAFRTEQISEEELTDILQAARFAPSSMGMQARHFTVVQDKKLIADIVTATVKNGGKFVPGHTPFYNAPTVIVLSAPESSKYNREDAACAVMNVMLAAHAYNLGTCYICSVLCGLRDEDIMKRLRLPENYIPLGCVALGYPAENAPAPKERRTDDINYVR
ncbi:MAG TPA: nitroreductase [Caproiciproducens sp.]|nr:nitroreductase [Caproiciproducens sp.]